MLSNELIYWLNLSTIVIDRFIQVKTNHVLLHRRLASDTDMEVDCERNEEQNQQVMVASGKADRKLCSQVDQDELMLFGLRKNRRYEGRISCTF